jgi:adiponectin receptor
MGFSATHMPKPFTWQRWPRLDWVRLPLFDTEAVPEAHTGASFIVLSPEYSKPSHRGARTAVFIGLGLCAIVPLCHMLLAHELNELMTEMGVNWLVGSGALYIGGALL